MSPVLRRSRLVVSALGALAACVALAAAQCPTTRADDGCAPLDDVCPSLQCVEHRRDDTGCPLCECAVQACATTSDCASRGLAVACDTAPSVCEPAPACTDGDLTTPCPAACFGRCVYEGAPARADGICRTPFDCGDGECRTTVCVDDPLTAVIDCAGFCASGCAEVETIALDPVSQQCAFFPDSCLPPGWVVDRAVCG